MHPDNLIGLQAKALCRKCIGDAFLQTEVRNNGKTRCCDYCQRKFKSYTIGELADRVEQVFDEHYIRTSTGPDEIEGMLMRDREISYSWYREGEPVDQVIAEAGGFPEAAASDIQAILADRHGDWNSAMMGEETEFDDDAQYELKRAGHGDWPLRWAKFEQGLKTETRFFNRTALEPDGDLRGHRQA